MKNRLYFWSRNKGIFTMFAASIIVSLIYGFWDWQAWMFTALFIAVFMAFGSRWNPAYRATIKVKNFPEKVLR